MQLYEILSNYTFCNTPIVREIDTYLRENLSQKRYDHTLLTVESALNLASQNRVNDHGDILKIVIAALGHDSTKEMPEEFHLAIFSKNGLMHFADVPDSLYHSHSAPYFLAEKFNISDPEIHHAIHYHSTGTDLMPLISRIIFCADFMASDFKNKSGNTAQSRLVELCFEKISTTLQYLISKKMPVQPESINFYNILIHELVDEKENRNA